MPAVMSCRPSPTGGVGAMIIAALLVGVGLLVSAWAATTRGYRLGGVVVISLLSIYTLVDFVALPVFVLSILLAYVGISLVQERWLLYGRQLFLTALLLGAVIPVAAFLAMEFLLSTTLVIDDMHYIGSILPGIAAYNFHRLDPERRLPEVWATVGLYLALMAVGVLTVVQWSRPTRTMDRLVGISPGEHVSPILLREGSDIAGFLGLATVETPPSVGTLGAVTVVIVLGLVIGELQRDRWGLRPAGVIALPLVALFALRAWWVVPMYVLIGVITFAIIKGVHRLTLLYGRALLSVGIVVGVVLAGPLLVVFGQGDTLAVFFTGFLGGIAAFNFHLIAPAERLENAVVTAGTFVVVFAVARTLVDPLANGLGSPLAWPNGLVSLLVLMAAIWVISRLEQLRPTDREFKTANPTLAEGHR